MREKYILETFENKNKDEVLSALVIVTMALFKENESLAEKLWYGKNGIAEKNFTQPVHLYNLSHL